MVNDFNESIKMIKYYTRIFYIGFVKSFYGNIIKYLLEPLQPHSDCE